MTTLGDFWLGAVFDGLKEMKYWETWAGPVIKMVMDSMTPEDEKAIISSLQEEIERDYTWSIVKVECEMNAVTLLEDISKDGITVDEEGYLSQAIGDFDRLCGSFYLGTYQNICHRQPEFDDNCVEMMDYFYEKALADVGYWEDGSCMVGVPDCGDVSYIIDFKPCDLEEKEHGSK